MIISKYDTEKHFVLTNEDEKIIAIIKAEAGEIDLTDKIKDAILADEQLFDLTVYPNDIVMSENGQTYAIPIMSKEFEEDDEEYNQDYYLTDTAIY